ncbi:ABC transporter permease [bacterium]|nr:ABC transporter permease [bacterium]
MRIVTYLGLVLRRIWSRRLMLLGSFLGATLVTALLTVLPLYEASVQAIDLLFTFRQAPDSVVDLNASFTMNDYSADDAGSARVALDEARASIATWYPRVDERTLSRELVVIPLGNPDWLWLAETWREAYAVDPDTPAPYPTPPREPAQTRLFTTAGLGDQVELIEGTLSVEQIPWQETDPRLRVVFGEDLARLTGLGVGDLTVLRPFVGFPELFELVEISGIAKPTDPTAVIWEAVNPGMLTYVDLPTFEAWVGPFALTAPGDDPWLRTDRGFEGLAASVNFTLRLDREAVELGTVSGLAEGVTSFTTRVARTEGIRTTTQLSGLIDEFDVRTVVFGAPILAMLALIVAGALYFLIYMAALSLERESAELALLRLRGASSWQTIGIHLMQSSLIAIGAILLAPWVARGLVALTGRIPPMSTLTGGDALSVVQSRSVIPFAVAGGLLTFVAMGLAIVPLARRSVLELRSLATRPARQSVWQKYYLDVFMVVLAGVILFELRQQGIVDTGADELGLDPFSIAAPALFLFAGSLLLLRLLPYVLRGVGWVMTKFRGMTAALPGWHLGRNPIPYGRLALLVWLTTGFGAFALTYAGTLEQSYEDRALFESGSDARVVADDVAFALPPDDAIGSPVLRAQGAARLISRVSELLAVDPETFTRVIAWRDDFAELPVNDALGVTALGTGPDWGVELPEGTIRLDIDGVIVPPSWVDVDSDGLPEPVRFMVRIADDRHRLLTYRAETSFTAEGWTSSSVMIDPERALPGPAVGGVAAKQFIQSIWVERDARSGASLEETEVLIGDVVAATASGEQSVFAGVIDELEGRYGLRASLATGEYALNAYLEEIPLGQSAPRDPATSPYFREGDVLAWDLPERVRSDDVPHMARAPERLPFVLDRESAGIAGVSVGSEALFGIEGEEVEGAVVAIIEVLPTTGDPRLNGAMVTDLDGLLQWLSGSPAWALTGTPARRAEPTEIWVKTDDPDGAVRVLTSQITSEPDAVITAGGVSADFSSRPIQVGLVSILFLGTGAGVVLALAGVTAYVIMAVGRRYREMGVLRALGLRRRSVAGTFALEQLVVLGVGAIVGVIAGLGLMRLMLPFLQLGEDADELLPAAIMQVSPSRLGIYLAVVTVLLVISVLWSTRSVSARRLSEVLREVER